MSYGHKQKSVVASWGKRCAMLECHVVQVGLCGFGTCNFASTITDCYYAAVNCYLIAIMMYRFVT